jgi:hypothetical protein
MIGVKVSKIREKIYEDEHIMGISPKLRNFNLKKHIFLSQFL